MKTKLTALVLFIVCSVNIVAEKNEKKNWDEMKLEKSNKMNEDGSTSFYIDFLSSVVELSSKQEKEIDKAFRDYHKKKKSILKSTNTYSIDRELLFNAKQEFDSDVNAILSLEQQDLLKKYHQAKELEAQSRYKEEVDTLSNTDSVIEEIYE